MDVVYCLGSLSLQTLISTCVRSSDIASYTYQQERIACINNINFIPDVLALQSETCIVSLESIEDHTVKALTAGCLKNNIPLQAFGSKLASQLVCNVDGSILESVRHDDSKAAPLGGVESPPEPLNAFNVQKRSLVRRQAAVPCGDNFYCAQVYNVLNNCAPEDSADCVCPIFLEDGYTCLECFVATGQDSTSLFNDLAHVYLGCGGSTGASATTSESSPTTAATTSSPVTTHTTTSTSTYIPPTSSTFSTTSTSISTPHTTTSTSSTLTPSTSTFTSKASTATLASTTINIVQTSVAAALSATGTTLSTHPNVANSTTASAAKSSSSPVKISAATEMAGLQSLLLLLIGSGLVIWLA